MYGKIRNIHLALGLLSAAFLLSYALGAFRMGHYFLFRWSSPTAAVSTVTLNDTPTSPPEIIAALRTQSSLRGDLFDVDTSSTGMTFVIRRPGTEHRVKYELASRSAQITTNSGGFWEMLDKLHHTGGMWHDEPELSAWGAYVGIVSALLAAIALSGLYLWFQRHKERRLGGIVFVLGMVGSIFLLIVVRALA